MKKHSFDPISLVFGLVFLTLAAGIGLANAVGWLLGNIPFGLVGPIVLVGLGTWMLVAAVLRGREQEAEANRS